MSRSEQKSGAAFKAKWKRRGQHGHELVVGDRTYFVLRLDRESDEFLWSTFGRSGRYVYDGELFNILRQAQARAEDVALTRVQKAAADLGMKVVPQ